MKSKFQKGQKVQVFKNGGLYITGTISSSHVNQCTYEMMYDVDFEKEGDILTLTCIPEQNIVALSN